MAYASAIAGLFLTPTVPFMVMFIVISGRRHRENGNLIRKSMRWLTMKGLNKVIGLQSAALSLSVFLAAQAFVSGATAILVGMAALSMIYALEATAIEDYSYGKLGAKVERESTAE